MHEQCRFFSSDNGFVVLIEDQESLMHAINHTYYELKSDILRLVMASKQSEAEDVLQRKDAQNDKFSSFVES